MGVSAISTLLNFCSVDCPPRQRLNATAILRRKTMARMTAIARTPPITPPMIALRASAEISLDGAAAAGVGLGPIAETAAEPPLQASAVVKTYRLQAARQRQNKTSRAMASRTCWQPVQWGSNSLLCKRMALVMKSSHLGSCMCRVTKRRLT